jgi:hypothetical protein
MRNTLLSILPLFVAVKITALFLIVCLAFVSVFTAKAGGMHMEKSCCHKMTKSRPCDHQQKDDCAQGMCNTMLFCNMCGFLKVDPVGVAPVVPVVRELLVTPYQQGSLSAYSPSSWRPPQV